MFIYNGKIHTMEQPIIENGYVEVHGERIVRCGSMQELSAFAPDAGDIDAGGAAVFPGFIDAHSHVGMWEDSIGFEGDDGNEETDPSTPQLRALDAINPIDRCFVEAVEAGVTTVLTGPGSANPIGGQWVAMKTGGRRIDDMVIAAPSSMKFALGENPKSVYHGKNQAPVTRMATAAIIRDQLQKAKRYMEDMEKAENTDDSEDECERPEYDMKCEALIPVLKRELRAHFHCHRSDDMFTAMRIAKEFNLDYVLVHATEGHLVADILADGKTTAIIGPILSDRSKPELRNASYRNAAALYSQGVPFAICTDHPVIPIQYLPLSAGICVRGGLPYEAALQAITINAARICGIDQRVGSLAPGKDADIVLFREDPLSVYATPELVLLNGKIAYRKA